MSLSSMFNNFKNCVARNYGEHPGKMLIHTGIIGWVLSSAAQVAAIVINDKIPKEQKMYLIPQEIADAGVNIASFYLITQSFKSLASKLVSTGKWLPKTVRTFLDNNGYSNNVGKVAFDVLDDAKLPADLASSYKGFSDGIDVLATTAGSILSCNIVTPILRNQIAARRQQTGIAKLNANKSSDSSESEKPQIVKPQGLRAPSMTDFQHRLYSSPNLKI
ncbi:hypothetical protein HDR58_03745 [bacterium]|nr:hypothetical protein [bacterium]